MATNEESTTQLVLRFGLSQEEIEKLTIKGALSYLRFHYPKKHNERSILFRGFSKIDTKSLTEIAENNSLTVKSRFSTELTFLCTNDNLDSKTHELLKGGDTKLLSKEDFEIIYSQRESTYPLKNNEGLYDLSIAPELRIAKPLSNFNFILKVNSFSLNRMDTQYDVNLFELYCTCDDFKQKERHKYLKGDIRRLCRHLMSAYYHSFGVFEQTKFSMFLFLNSFPYEKHTRNFVIDKTNQNVILHFDNAFDWWNIYLEDKDGGSFKKYAYSPSEKGFAYDSKPIGIVPPLRAKLEQIRQEFSYKPTTKTSNQKIESGGCASIVAVVALIVLILNFLCN